MTIIRTESGKEFNIQGWSGSCASLACTTPGKDPQQEITAPDGTFIEWGDGISRDGGERAIEFIMGWFGCSEEDSIDILDAIFAKSS